MQCVFVNTEASPTIIKRMGYFTYAVKEQVYIWSELCELIYPHPDAPENATVSVMRFLEVTLQPGTNLLAKHAVDANKSISAISELKYPPPKTVID